VTGRVVIGGECLVDRITIRSGEVREVPGGGPYNTARTIARLGVHAAFLGCVSRDALGARLMQELMGDGVDLTLVVRTDAPTTVAHATLDAGGAASYRFEVEGTAAPALEGSDALRALDPPPSAIHVGTLGLVFEPVGSSLEALVHATPRETLVMLDPNARPSAMPDVDTWRARIARIARRADLIRASADDLAAMAPGVEPLAAAASLAADGTRVVIVTDGAGPVRVLGSGGDPLIVPVPAGPVVDTVGAGDAFGGGFLAWWIEHGLGRDGLRDRALVLAATRFAVRVAALTCARAGADPPRRSELQV
jgi:fructokinase